jgi:hypothetical protein
MKRFLQWASSNGVSLLLFSVAAVFLLLILTSCGRQVEPYQDAPVGEVDEESADLVRMPDGFSNVAAKCDGTTRVYVVFHNDANYGSVAVAPNHPKCGGK